MKTRLPFYDAHWMEQPDLDPWVLTTQDPLSLEHRDAFIGNGLIGQRISPWGDASLYEGRSQSRMYGLWGRDKLDNEALLELPTWAILDFRHPGPMGRPCEHILHHAQSLDLRTGTVETRYRVEGSHWAGNVCRRAWVSRKEPHLAVLELEIVPEFGWYIQVIERFDASWMTQTHDLETSFGKALHLKLSLGPDKRPLSLSSRLLTHGQEPAWQDEHQSEDNLSRSTWIAITPGKPIKLTRLIAIEPTNSPQLALDDLDPDKLRAGHEAAWGELWQNRIEIPHPASQQLIHASLYHLYSQASEDHALGVGPCGISGDGYQGRIFWDAETWIFPPLALLQPQLARGFVAYRFHTREGAQENAREDGCEGACFAWESASTGKEWVPIPEIHHQRHVNSDVAYAQWIYKQTSGDTATFEEMGVPVILDAARYWSSRVVYNDSEDRYELRAVYCADEYAGVQDNNASTNFGAAWTLRKAADLAEQFDLNAPIDHWRDIAEKMFIPWDEEAGVIAEFEGWTDDRIIKQADTVLMIYPWQAPLPDDLKKRMVAYYRAHYPENKIMMGSAIDGIIDCELGQPGQAWDSLLDLLPHLHPPYFTASESPSNDCMNFITGFGGLLQLVLNGFGGIRILENELKVKPQLPDAWPWMRIHGVHFNGIRHDLFLE